MNAPATSHSAAGRGLRAGRRDCLGMVACWASLFQSNFLPIQLSDSRVVSVFRPPCQD